MANAVGVAHGKPENHSFDWRRTLDKVGELTTVRRNHARTLLAASPASKRYQSLSLSDPAMDLLCEKVSSIRDDGNKVAHPNLSADELQDLRKVVPHLLDPKTREGLEVVIDFLVHQEASKKASAS